MSTYDSLKLASGLALAGLGTSLGYSQSNVSPLENMVAQAPANIAQLNSGVGFYPANDSFYSMGVNGIQQIELYSDSKKTNAKMAVKMQVSEGVYDWRNEQKAEVSVLILPDGSSLPTPKPSLDLNYNKTLNGKSARGGLFGLGFYAASTAAGPALIAAVAEAGIDYAVGKSRDRSVNASTLKHMPDQKFQSTVDRIANTYEINGKNYTLSIDVNSKGKEHLSKFNPDQYDIKVVNLEQYGGRGQAFEITSRDHRMRNNIWAILAGYTAGSLYDALTKSGASIAGSENNGSPYTPPTGTPPTTPGITGGEGAGSGYVPPIPPGGG